MRKNIEMSKEKASKARHLILAAALTLPAVAQPLSSAWAVSWRVKMACASDYYSYCSSYEVGSQQLRQCMRANGPKLSSSCVSALIEAGEVTQAEVSRRAASVRKASM